MCMYACESEREMERVFVDNFHFIERSGSMAIPACVLFTLDAFARTVMIMIGIFNKTQEVIFYTICLDSRKFGQFLLSVGISISSGVWKFYELSTISNFENQSRYTQILESLHKIHFYMNMSARTLISVASHITHTKQIPIYVCDGVRLNLCVYLPSFLNVCHFNMHITSTITVDRFISTAFSNTIVDSQLFSGKALIQFYILLALT